MKTTKTCKECKRIILDGYKCDTCNKTFLCSPITVKFGYGHKLDTMEVHFCGDKCAIKYFTNEENKK